jgi:ubiquinone/menaquinone biosynthesis C-methylase UbiE
MKTKRILNVGCGEDTFGTHFVDLFPARTGVIKWNGDKDRLPFQERFFDEVYSKNLFEHLRNPGHALAEMYRVLKTNGRLVLITDNASYWVWAVGRTHHGGYKSSICSDIHYSVFTKEHLINHARKFSFKNIQATLTIVKNSFFIRVINRILSLTPFRRFAFNCIKLTATK